MWQLMGESSSYEFTLEGPTSKGQHVSPSVVWWPCAKGQKPVFWMSAPLYTALDSSIPPSETERPFSFCIS